MNKNRIKIKYSLIVLLLISVLTFTVIGCINKTNNEVISKDFQLTLEGYGAKDAFVDKDMSIVDMLMYAVQDEYLARAEYFSMMDKYDDTRPYSNIMKSEETHMNILKIFTTTITVEQSEN